jgi:uncharacterized protein with PQ loop repeat
MQEILFFLDLVPNYSLTFQFNPQIILIGKHAKDTKEKKKIVTHMFTLCNQLIVLYNTHLILHSISY